MSLSSLCILAINHCDKRPFQKVEEKRNHDKSKSISLISCSRLILKPPADICLHSHSREECLNLIDASFQNATCETMKMTDVFKKRFIGLGMRRS